jgi:hypothetical protein
VSAVVEDESPAVVERDLLEIRGVEAEKANGRSKKIPQ